MTAQVQIGKLAAKIIRHCVATYEARGVVLNQADMQLIGEQSWQKAKELYFSK